MTQELPKPDLMRMARDLWTTQFRRWLDGKDAFLPPVVVIHSELAAHVAPSILDQARR